MRTWSVFCGTEAVKGDTVMMRTFGPLVVVALLMLGTGVVDAQDMVGDVVVDPQAPVGDGVATITGTYDNLGPDPAENANMYYFFGVSPGTATGDGFAAVIDSAVGTDTMGNQAFGVLLDDTMCNHIGLVLEQPNPDGGQPMLPIAAGTGGAFTFELPVAAGPGTPAIPMEGIDAGRLVITEPESLRNTYDVTLPQFDPPFHQLWAYAGLHNLVSQGVGCFDGAANCEDLEYCFGRRLWEVEPFEAEAVVAQDGSPINSACNPLTNAGEIAGKIALVRRGDCQFQDKAENVQDAGGAGMIIVNHTSPTGDTCVGQPDADPQECVISMAPAAAGEGRFVDLPFVMMSQRQGEELFAAIGGGQTVRAAMGAVPGDTVGVFPWAYDLLDPNLENDLQVIRVPLAYVFMDGFEMGDCSMWSAEVP